MSKTWKWCLVDDNNNILSGWQQVGENWYYLFSNGTMATGWVQIENKWYYLNPTDGTMQTGWLKENGKWYYLNPLSDGNKGVMYAGCTVTIDNKEYTFNSDGSMVENSSLVSDALVNFVKSYEGFSDKHYDDGTGVDTIGYGSTNGWIMNLTTCTKEQATQALKEEINKMANAIKKDLDKKGVTLTQNQFDALCSFAYNCGTTALFGSTLYKRIISGVRDSTLKDNFTVWSKAGGRTMQGLLNRRIEEYEIFANVDYIRNL